MSFFGNLREVNEKLVRKVYMLIFWNQGDVSALLFYRENGVNSPVLHDFMFVIKTVFGK